MEVREDSVPVSDKPTVTRICTFCGAPFEAVRTDAKFHSVNCRMRAMRWRKRLPDHAVKAMNNVEAIAGYLHFEDTRQPAMKELRRLKAFVIECLQEGDRLPK